MVSFIVPVYNAGSYLTSCVESLLAQGLEDGSYEIVLVNNGSTDGSDGLCQKLSEKHDCIRTITQEKRGVSEARNSGVMAACGEYVCFVDADDRLVPNGISSVLEYCDGTNDLIRYWCEFVNPVSPSKMDMGDGSVSFSGSGMDYLRKFGLETICLNYLYRKTFLEENELSFRPEICCGEDFTFMFDVMMADPRIISVSRRIYQYCIHPNSVSTNRSYENSRRWVSDLMGTMMRIATILYSYRETDSLLYDSCWRSMDNKTVSLFSRILSAKYTVKDFREIVAFCRAGGLIPLVTQSNAAISILCRLPHVYPVAGFLFRRVFLPFIYPLIDKKGA